MVPFVERSLPVDDLEVVWHISGLADEEHRLDPDGAAVRPEGTVEGDQR